MKNKLWQVGDVRLQKLVEAYTVAGDYALDQILLPYDIKASKAHADMLHSIGVLTLAEADKLTSALDDLLKLWEEGKFRVKKEQEDGHTAIEAYLTEKLGDVGKKIHTGRSRNDQSLAMTRLYLKDALSEVNVIAEGLVKTLNEAATKAGDTPMPGYTHTQKAMPTTVATWLGSYADAFADVQKLIESTRDIIDQNPLGSAAGFGVSLPLDRDKTTKALGFKKTQTNPMYCGLSRGLFELLAVQTLNPLMILSGKFAQDMILFTAQEFDLFGLSDSFTTGSSIMPQKHNYDLFEIMRATANTFGSHVQQLQSIVAGVGSGYHRDLQLTKTIAYSAFSSTKNTLELLGLAVANLQLHKDKLKAAITPEMLSVVEINKLVDQGIPFRDAYQQVKAKLEKKKN